MVIHKQISLSEFKQELESKMGCSSDMFKVGSPCFSYQDPYCHITALPSPARKLNRYAFEGDKS